MIRDIRKIIAMMTLNEKAGLCSGYDFWHTKAIERLGIPSIMMTDGPHGLRKQSESSDHLGLNDSVPATCFPSGAGLACSWDRDLIEKVGVALGEECQAENVAIILGPAANIKRSPLCGRNFEYLSEDPYLSSEMAAHHIKGVQSQGVGTSLKHFAVNNQEHRRMTVDAKVDERTLREIYLASFEGAVKKGEPWTVMCSYNKLNGVYASQNKYLLKEVLKEQWGFKGLVVSDWGAVYEREAGVTAGMDLEMPSSNGEGDRKIVDAVKKGELSIYDLDNAVERILNIVFKAADNKKENATYNKDEHHKLAKEVAEECMILLKNEDAILPLQKNSIIAVIGAFAKAPRYQGGGSSHIKPTRLDNIFNEIEKKVQASKVLYAEGYTLANDDIDEKLICDAVEAASKVNVAVIFAGLPGSYESEGYDRKHLRIPNNQIKLIEEVAKVQSNCIVILSNGAPVEMPWLSSVKGLLECYLGGQALGGSVADILFGEANPSGKLAETFPINLKHNPSYLNFPGEGDKVEYKEGIFVGYRYYDAKEIETLFPFGYGLSYTNFKYSNISVDKKEIYDDEIINVNVTVKNIGKVKGKEIVQLYVSDLESSVIRPIKELKGFEKVDLKPGEEKIISFTLDKRAFAYYNVGINDWYVESGDFEILVGGSSKDISLKEIINVKSTISIKKEFTVNSTIGDLMSDPVGAALIGDIMKKALGQLGDISSLGGDMSAMINGMLLRSMVAFSGRAFTNEMLDQLLKQLNK